MVPRPRWTSLYGLAALAVASAAGVEVFGPVGRVRTILTLGVVIGVSIAIACWVRVNGVSLDAEDWCECAGAKTTMRVIPSRRPAASIVLPSLPVAHGRLDQEKIEEHLTVAAAR